jgi:F-type H+-transporting ATPase subunit gamma
VAEERGLAYARFAPMISHPTQATALAERLTRTIFEALAHARVRQVFVVHATSAAGGQIDTVTRRLLPFDFGRFPEIRDDHPPLITLPVDKLLEQLAEDYIFADLTLAIMQSMAAENEARMRAMIAAHENVTETMAELVAVSRRLRQDQITEEIVELAVGSQAAEHGRKRSYKAPVQAGSP